MEEILIIKRPPFLWGGFSGVAFKIAQKVGVPFIL